MQHFIKVISFLPDNLDYTLNPSDRPGWYTLYQPQADPNNTSPSLIYFDPAGTDYLGWTTITPLNCQGNSNYILGKCQLIYQYLEDSRLLQKDINRGNSNTPVGKSVIPVAGRILNKDIFLDLPEVEIFCLYSLNNSCVKYRPNGPNPTLPTELTNWNVGLATYSETTSGPLVATKIFGQYVKATIRAIGRLKDYTGSLVPHVIIASPGFMPQVNVGTVPLAGNYIYVGRVLKFTGLIIPSSITLIFPETVYGSVPPLPEGNSLTIVGEKIKIRNNSPNLDVDLSNLVFLNTVTSFTILIGNAIYNQNY